MATPTRPIVELESVDVDIDGRRVLHDISLEIQRGSHYGIVGGNGSGKSTLLALISGRRWPAPGRGSRIYEFGRGPERDAVAARERLALIGHELQDLYVARQWNFRARDVVHSGLTRTDIPRRRARPGSRKAAEILLEAMELGHLSGSRFLELSRGEQRRVLIARGLAFEPALLLLDEPASGLDTRSRANLEATLMLAARNTPIVVTAHRADELPRFVTVHARLVHGRLTVAGTQHSAPDPRPASSARRERAPPGERRAADGAGARRGKRRARQRMIVLEGVDVWLGGRRVLKDLDWELRSGDSWLITGDNGAGKSTFLRLLNAEVRAARGGRIRWPGLGDPRNVWALRRRVSLVSPELQGRYLFPTRVFDAVASGFRASIGLTGRLDAKQYRRVESLLEAFELDTLGNRMLSTLSYGQRHRTLIARSLVTDPEIVLLDEPWEGLDPASSELVAAQLARRMAAGTQIVCVSHIGGRKLRLNRRLTLAGGEIVDVDGSGAPRESFASAQPPAAGSPPR